MALFNIEDFMRSAKDFMTEQEGAAKIVNSFNLKEQQKISQYSVCFGCFDSHWIIFITRRGVSTAKPCVCVNGGPQVSIEALPELNRAQVLEFIRYIELCRDFANKYGTAINRSELLAIFNIPWNEESDDYGVYQDGFDVLRYKPLFDFMSSLFEQFPDFQQFKDRKYAN
jgi:hypothetical protein